MTQKVSWAAANLRRLQRHALLTPAPSGTDPAEIAAVICGAHAQVLSAAELSLALRIQAATRTSVKQALWEKHRLVKTYGPRGTVHLLPAADLPMWMAALSAIPEHSPFPDGVRLTPNQAEEIVAAIGRALEDAELTIDELDQAVIDLAGAWAGDRVMPAFQDLWPRWRQAVVSAAYRGVLCFGPNRGRRVTYTSPRRWTPGFSLSAPDTAIATIIRRYLYAYGPATPQQFAQWFGAPPRWAAEQFERRSRKLTKINFEGTPAWLSHGDTDMPAEEAGRRRPAAAILRRVRRRQPSAIPALPWCGRYSRAGALGPGRQLSGPDHQRLGRWRLAPASLRPPDCGDRRAAHQAHCCSAPGLGEPG
jgi:Winged helix DNA-binding domain